MAQQGPNPIEIYEQALAQYRPILAAIKAEQHKSSTLCTDWTVEALINHSLATQRFAQAVLSKSGADPSVMADVNHPLPAEGAIAALNSISSEVPEYSEVVEHGRNSGDALRRHARRAIYHGPHH